jgi:predicted lipoprotein with Yx(FWY)xxD motif
MLVALAAGAGLATLAGMALAKTFTLNVAKHGEVTDTTMTKTEEPIAVNSHGIAVYRLAGETTHHFLCTNANGCLSFWFPVTAPAHGKPTAAAGIKGKLGKVKRGSVSQLTLGGHPLYTFKLDGHEKAHATGEGIVSFGGTWHVITASAKGGTTSTNPTTSTSTTTTMPCIYPPCY